jgi:peptidoglycan/xylan/chitin deacetylase (PgdA/CDA1 family)
LCIHAQDNKQTKLSKSVVLFLLVTMRNSKYLNSFIKYLCSLIIVVIFSISPGLNQSGHSADGTLRRIFVPILMYHYVSPLPPAADAYRIDLTVEPELFKAHIQYLKSAGYSSVSLYEVDQALRTGSSLPPRPVVLTFDDGYIDHYTYVFPILQEFSFTGTFFIITGFADNNYPAYLSWQQIKTMSDAGMNMEAHTKNHADLRQRSRDFLIYEVVGSIESLNAHTALNSRFFAYPVGQYDEATLALLSETPIWRALTTQHGALHTTDNRLEMSRIRIHGNTGVAGLEQLLNKNPPAGG